MRKRELNIQGEPIDPIKGVFPGFPSKVSPKIVEIIYGNKPTVCDGKGPYEWKLGPGLKAQMKEYTYNDLKAAYEGGVGKGLYSDEYIQEVFTKWFKDEFNAKVNEHK